MKYTNEPSAKTAISWGCHLVDEFLDEVNELTKVFMITKDEWKMLKQKKKGSESMSKTLLLKDDSSLINGLTFPLHKQRFGLYP